MNRGKTTIVQQTGKNYLPHQGAQPVAQEKARDMMLHVENHVENLLQQFEFFIFSITIYILIFSWWNS